MKKLGKVLIWLSLALIFVEIGWHLFRELIYEPAGNVIQVWFLALPLWLARWLFYLPDNLFLVNQANFFWFGVALLIYDKIAIRERINRSIPNKVAIVAQHAYKFVPEEDREEFAKSLKQIL